MSPLAEFFTSGQKIAQEDLHIHGDVTVTPPIEQRGELSCSPSIYISDADAASQLQAVVDANHGSDPPVYIKISSDADGDVVIHDGSYHVVTNTNDGTPYTRVGYTFQEATIHSGK